MNNATDGFNERIVYIQNSNGQNNLSNNSIDFDNSYAKMKADERGFNSNIKTTGEDKVFTTVQARGEKENFVVVNTKVENVNSTPSPNDPVKVARERNVGFDLNQNNMNKNSMSGFHTNLKGLKPNTGFNNNSNSLMNHNMNGLGNRMNNLGPKPQGLMSQHNNLFK